MNKKTYSPKGSDIERAWYVVDAEGKTLGRLSTEIARVLTGKHKPIYAPHVDTGDFVVVINAEKTVVTGKKETDKVYYHHSGYIGSIRSETVAEVRENHPRRLIERAVRGMLPKNRLGRRQYSKLKVYAGPEHPHAAQKPSPFEAIGA